MARSYRDQIARKAAEEVAATLGIEISTRASYTYRDTGCAAAWRIVGNQYGARIAVNVEDEEHPYVVIETGPVSGLVHHESYDNLPGLGWIAKPYFLAAGSAHPVLH